MLIWFRLETSVTNQEFLSSFPVSFPVLSQTTVAFIAFSLRRDPEPFVSSGWMEKDGLLRQTVERFRWLTVSDASPRLLRPGQWRSASRAPCAWSFHAAAWASPETPSSRRWERLDSVLHRDNQTQNQIKAINIRTHTCIHLGDSFTSTENDCLKSSSLRQPSFH